MSDDFADVYVREYAARICSACACNVTTIDYGPGLKARFSVPVTFSISIQRASEIIDAPKSAADLASVVFGYAFATIARQDPKFLLTPDRTWVYAEAESLIRTHTVRELMRICRPILVRDERD